MEEDFEGELDEDEQSMSKNDESTLRLMEQLNRRLTELENKMNQNGSTILDEKHVPDRSSLGGKVFVSTLNGVQKDVRIPVCLDCGKTLDNSAVFCFKCDSPLCSECAILFEGKSFCRKHLKNKLDKKTFKVLLLANIGIVDTRIVSRLTGLARREVRLAWDKLLKKGYLIRKGISFFSRYEVSHHGLIILIAWKKAFQRDEDIVHFENRMQEWISSREEISNGKRRG